MRRYAIIRIRVLCPRSGSHRKVKQNDNLCPVQDSGSLAVFIVTARDQVQYKGLSGAYCTYCNISCFTVANRNCFDNLGHTLSKRRPGTHRSCLTLRDGNTHVK